MLNRLVGRAVFTQTDRVMGVDVDAADFHQRGHTHRITGVLYKHQEGRGVRHKAAVQRNPVGNRRHAKFTHAVVDIITRVVFIQRDRAGPDGQVARCQVGRAAQEFRQQFTVGFQCIL
nr:hypothetical protein PB20LOC_04392 [Pectobacterium parmentieri]